MSNAEPAASPLAPLLDYLLASRAVDLGVYRTPTLLRQIARRMQDVQVESVPEYVNYLAVHPDEFRRLFDSVLISVTSFFRDSEAWEALARLGIPAIAALKPDDGPIRVWSAGCASGEEAFALAILWCQHLGIDQFRARLEIHGTDIDESALAIAREGAYDSAQLAGVPDDLRSRYFERSGTRHAFRADLRPAVVFSRHDLTQDAPISGVDLLVCRNTLSYLTHEARGRILLRFHSALAPNGMLFLGKSETLSPHASLFHAVDPKHRVFAKAGRVEVEGRSLSPPQSSEQDPAHRVTLIPRLAEEALRTMPIAQIVLDREGVLVAANQLARSSFALATTDIGRRFRDLGLAREAVDLRPLIEHAQVGREPVTIDGVERSLSGGGAQVLDVQVTPLRDDAGRLLGISVVFRDATETRQLRSELRRIGQALYASKEELTAANEALAAVTETLRSTVEELAMTNTELQSGTREHATLNEALRAAAHELGAITERLGLRPDTL